MPLRVLALHGYTQSGPGFQKKVHKLEIRLREEFGDVQFHFETAPIKLKTSELATIKSQQKSEDEQEQDIGERKGDPDDAECYAWFNLEDHPEPPRGFFHSFDMLAKCLEERGPFDGVLGFSQGGLMAIMLASLLEGDIRKEAFANAAREFSDSIPFPESFKNIRHPPFKFGITYGALMGVTRKYAPFYENPRVQTPFCQFSGLYDPVVTVEMATAVNRAQIGGTRSIRVTHPGAHHVCVERKYLDTVVHFVKDNIAPTLDLLMLMEKSTTEEVDSSIGEMSSSSASSVSDKSSASLRPGYRRRISSPKYGKRRHTLGTVQNIRSTYYEDRIRSYNISSESSNMDMKMSLAEREISVRHMDKRQPWLEDALDIFLKEWIQAEASHGRPPPLMTAQEMAARILRKYII